jgi:hypothetical protein
MITAILQCFNSKPDSYGNRYWAFRWIDTPSAKRVEAQISGGESDITAIVRSMGLRWESCLYSRQEMGIRDFRRIVKDWPHAGCAPDELAEFIRRTLNKT